MINWRKREEHPETFEDGERLLVAVQLMTGHWAFNVITTECDGDYVDCRCNGEYWGWDWSDVSYWCPLSEIEATLPKG